MTMTASSPLVGKNGSPEPQPPQLPILLRTNTGWSKRVLCFAGFLGLVILYFGKGRFSTLPKTRPLSVPNQATRPAATARSTTVDAFRQRHVRSRTLQADADSTAAPSSAATVVPDIPYRIRLVLALEYLNDDAAFAIESSRTIPSTGAALHFCRAVNEQAGGSQVRSNARDIDATIVTKISPRANGRNDYQCLLRETNRNYDLADTTLLDRGLFTLEIVVEQLVHVTSPDGQDLSFAQVAEIVKTGFNRGQGGRVRFRELLRAHPVLRDLADVEVLDDVSPPQEPPSPSPSTVPSDYPSFAPSLVPTNFPSLTPSLEPSAEPTSTVSQSPTMIPSVVPSTSPTVIATEQSSRRQPLIILAICGGLATILVSLFFIFCVWHPLCGQQWNKNDHDAAGGAAGRDDHRPTGNSTTATHAFSSSQSSQPTVPAELNLTEDSLSLANTSMTVGENAPLTPKSNHVTKQHPIHIGGMGIGTGEAYRIADSFDEGSVYTTGGAASEVEVVLTSFSSSVHDVVLSNATAANEEAAPEELDDSDVPLDKVTVVESTTMSEDLLVPEEQMIETANIVQDSEVDNMETKGFDPFETGADTDDASSFGFNSKGDFEGNNENENEDEDSSFGFGSSVALSDPSFGHVNAGNSGKVSVSSNSTKTKGVANLVPGASHAGLDIYGEDKGLANWQWATGYERSDRDDVLSLASQGASTERSTGALRTNDLLLRTLLEGASRDLAGRKASSSKSRGSLHSAPSRLLSQRSKLHQRNILTNGRPPTHLSHHLDQKQESAPTFSSSLSVGSNPRSRPASRAPSMGSFDGALPFERFAVSPLNRPVLDDEKLWRSPSPSGRRLLIEEYDITMPESDEILGARSRLVVNSASTGSKSPETLVGINDGSVKNGSAVDPPTSTPLSAWYDDDESTLGARPRVGDNGSSSTHSSRSEIAPAATEGNSVGSTYSYDSKHSGRRLAKNVSGADDAAHGGRMSSPLSLASTLETREEHKSDLTPRSLEQELSRLDMHRSTGSRGQTTISSVAESSFGGSRSTLSSRVDPTRNEVRVVVYAPPGKIDVVLGNQRDGKGTFVAEVRPSSSLIHKLSPGDKLVAVDGIDVTKMPVGRITALMAYRASQERRLTVVTSSPFAHAGQETKDTSP